MTKQQDKGMSPAAGIDHAAADLTASRMSAPAAEGLALHDLRANYDVDAASHVNILGELATGAEPAITNLNLSQSLPTETSYQGGSAMGFKPGISVAPDLEAPQAAIVIGPKGAYMVVGDAAHKLEEQLFH